MNKTTVKAPPAKQTNKESTHQISAALRGQPTAIPSYAQEHKHCTELSSINKNPSLQRVPEPIQMKNILFSISLQILTAESRNSVDGMESLELLPESEASERAST